MTEDLQEKMIKKFGLGETRKPLEVDKKLESIAKEAARTFENDREVSVPKETNERT